MKSRESKTKFAILGMLSFGPQSGYEISQRIQNSTAFFWAESDGQLYPILRKLTQERLLKVHEVSVEGKRRKKNYEITEEGEVALIDWLHQAPTTFNTRNEFLLQLFYGHNISAEDNIEKIKNFQQALKQQLQLFNIIEQRIKEKSKHPTYSLLTLSYGQLSLKAEIAWCETATKYLEKENE